MRDFSCEAHRRLTGSPHACLRVARSQPDDHGNPPKQPGPARRHRGASAIPLLAAGFALGAVTIGSMSIALTPGDPPEVRPIELKGPVDRERSGERSDRERRRRGAERPERRRREIRGQATPSAPQARRHTPRRPAPPASAPAPPPPQTRPSPTRPQPRPAPPREPQPQPTPPPQPAPTPPPPPPPADTDDDAAGDDEIGGDN
jgi:hypothetical protein